MMLPVSDAKVSCGIPQIVLPAWYDTYQYAARVEYLGIGIYGNRKVAPSVEAEEFGQALSTILLDKKDGKAQNYRVQAEKLGVISRKAGGRKRACEAILEICGKVKA